MLGLLEVDLAFAEEQVDRMHEAGGTWTCQALSDERLQEVCLILAREALARIFGAA